MTYHISNELRQNRSLLKEQVLNDAAYFMQYFSIKEDKVKDYDYPSAYISDDLGNKVMFIGDFNKLRHTLTTYNQMLTIFDNYKDLNSWSYSYSKKVYEKVNNQVNERLYEYLKNWGIKLREDFARTNFKRSQSSMSKAGVLKNELKTLVKKILLNQNATDYASQLNNKYNIINGR